MKKNLLALVMALVLAFSLAGEALAATSLSDLVESVANDIVNDGEKPAEEAAPADAEKPAEEAAPADAEKPAEEAAPADAEKPAEEASAGAEKDAATEEIVLVDQDGLKIVSKGFAERDKYSYAAELKLYIENNTDKDLKLMARQVSVNGYMFDALLYVEVAAGKKANDKMRFDDDRLKSLGFETIADIEMVIEAVDNDYETVFRSDVIKLKTAAAADYDYKVDDSGEVLVDKDGIKIVAKSFREGDDIWGPAIMLFIQNSTDQTIMVQSSDVSVNGFMLDAIMSSEVAPGKVIIDGLRFDNDDLKDNDITKVEEVEFGLRVMNADWDELMTVNDLKVTID